ncbi:MAG: ATP-binding cassette domain-containing protein [Acidimicrobiia bacterium]|jgi:ATPase subunit of ABC transporter with duplicated ATPase domains
MPAVHFDDVSFRYTSAVEVFSGLTLHLGAGWTGVVGGNGAGKSTLLSLIDGSLSVTKGRIVLDPADAIVTRCPQEVETLTREIERLASAATALDHQWMGRLDLYAGDLARWPTLSPGERKRWQLAAALAREPDILLLDEPTNHIDTPTRDLIRETLARFPGAGLVISHDRDFLDHLTSRTLRVGGGSGRVWAASYSVAHKAWSAEEAHMRDRHETAKRQEKAQRRRLAEERRQGEERSARFRRSMREADPADHDATSLAAKSRHAGGEAAGSKRRSVMRADLERAAETTETLAGGRSLGGDIFFDYEPAPKELISHYSGPLRAGDTVLIPEIVATVGRNDRVRLTGANGAGKTTLLGLLTGVARIPAERILHLPQELSRQEIRAVLGEVDGLDPHAKGRVLSVVAALGVDPNRLLASRRPSPGEARKLALALGLGKNSWCLLLDEPTNHLDIEAVERVEAAIAGFPGALVVVTHDESFARATTTTEWHLSDDRLDIGDANKTPGSLPQDRT